jgi:hypothetical protein
MFVVMNRQGRYLTIPQGGKRMGSWAEVRPHEAEWLADVDCATRFDSEDHGGRAAVEAGFPGADVMPLEEAMRWG